MRLLSYHCWGAKAIPNACVNHTDEHVVYSHKETLQCEECSRHDPDLRGKHDCTVVTEIVAKEVQGVVKQDWVSRPAAQEWRMEYSVRILWRATRAIPF